MTERITDRIRALENEATITDRLAGLRARMTEAGTSEAEISATLEREQTRLNAAFEASTVERELEARAARKASHSRPSSGRRWPRWRPRRSA